MSRRERLAEYIASLEPASPPLLVQIENRARKEHIPIIRQETGALLKTLITALCPKQILEVGTAVGYSALLMAGAMPLDSYITTIENDKRRIPVARENFTKAKMEERITLLEGDAGEIIKCLPEAAYEFIFMDAAKGQYIHWLPRILQLLAPGGVLVSDNVLQEGNIIESRFAVERRDRTIHRRMREYLFELKHSKNLETAVLAVGDGVTVSVKKG